MCEFISGVLTEHKTYFLMDSDSHTDIRNHYMICDDVNPNIPINSVNVELVPRDKNIFNFDPDNWQLNIDQNDLPEWFISSAKEFARQEMLSCLAQRVKQRFHINLTQRIAINDGVHYVLNSAVTAKNSAVVHAYKDASFTAKERVVVYAYDNALIFAEGFSVIARAQDNVKLRLYDSSTCVEAFDNVKIVARGCASARVFGQKCKIKVEDYAVVRLYFHPDTAFMPINYNNYKIGISQYRPILDFVYQKKLFTEDEQLEFLRKESSQQCQSQQ